MNRQKKPLLYIHQPRLNDVKSSMQEVYRGSPSIVQPEREERNTQSIEMKRNSAELIEAAPLGRLKQPEYHTIVKREPKEVRSIIKETTNSEEANQRESGLVHSHDGYFKPLTPFKDLDMDGKIEYMQKSIMGRAPFPCAFQTEEGVYRGVLTSADSASIDIKTFQGEEVTLKRNSIKAIKIIGLK
ncbi:CotO family spore coat protein [Rossellomorea aquimaris]|uniref:CotO family spore coat protein n=1 Tax=Rossellomorea aquimaris TaxID=189382 RepID=UPI00165379E0|nr:CotO family spore coat protein [Rossellomorea aquimaris]